MTTPATPCPSWTFDTLRVQIDRAVRTDETQRLIRAAFAHRFQTPGAELALGSVLTDLGQRR